MRGRGVVDTYKYRMRFDLFSVNKSLRLFRWLNILAIVLLNTATGAHALPPCSQRAHFLDPPWVEGTQYCLELVIEDESPAELVYTALATAPDGTLFATRPIDGQVVAITDTDNDRLPDHSDVVADGLMLPNGLAWHDSTLYITGGPNIYRLREGQIEILVNDLPIAPGGWAGDITVGPDERLYFSVGGVCDHCIPQQPASILSVTLEGDDRRIEASGLRQAAGLAFHDDRLWATDSARYGLYDVPQLDELNQVESGVHFGWPYCVGANNVPDDLAEADDFDCATATRPSMTFDTGSTPLRLAAYNGDILPTLTDTLLVVLNGSRNRVDLRGYALAVISFDETGIPSESEILIPNESESNAKVGFSVAEMNYRTSGFWPHRPLAVTVAPEGWVYVSESGGRIMAIRPR